MTATPHRPSAAEIARSVEIPPDVADLARTIRLNPRLYLSPFSVSPALYIAVEDFLQHQQRARMAAWTAAGQPDDWPVPLGLLFIGPNHGLLFHGVELLPLPA